MSDKQFHIVPLAIGEFAVLETFAVHPDNLEETTDSGIVISTQKQDFSKALPRYAKVVSKGSLVPDSELNVGDFVVFPLGGHASNIEDPRIVNGQKITEKEKRQFSYVHWKNIGARYIQE